MQGKKINHSQETMDKGCVQGHFIEALRIQRRFNHK